MALGFIDVARLERVTCFRDKRIFLCAACFVERFTTVGPIKVEYVRSADCNSRGTSDFLSQVFPGMLTRAKRSDLARSNEKRQFLA